MKIALIIPKLGGEFGGLERDFENFALSLKKRGEEVHIFGSLWKNEIPGIIYHRVSAPRFPKWLNPLLFARKIEKALDPMRFDFIVSSGKTFSHHVLRDIGVQASVRRQNLNSIQAWAPRMLRRFFYAISLKEKVHFYLERRSFQASGDLFVVANSSQTKEEILRRYPIQDRRIAVIHNGVDSQRFHPSNRLRPGTQIRKELGMDSRIVIGFVAHNFRLKGLAPLVRAASHLQERKDWRLLIIGKDASEPYLKQSRKLGIDGHICFAGQVAEIERYYGAMDFLVHPTYYDPFSNVILEAMASGMPVITTRQNGTSEIISEGEEGYILSRPDDVALLADRMTRLFDRERRETMGLKARRLAEKWTLERNLREFFSQVPFPSHK